MGGSARSTARNTTCPEWCDSVRGHPARLAILWFDARGSSLALRFILRAHTGVAAAGLVLDLMGQDWHSGDRLRQSH